MKIGQVDYLRFLVGLSAICGRAWGEKVLTSEIVKYAICSAISSRRNWGAPRRCAAKYPVRWLSELNPGDIYNIGTIQSMAYSYAENRLELWLGTFDDDPQYETISIPFLENQ